jgi:AcrR family transcriptional regulator
MGHREDLLAGAKRCLYERGYAHTTARDIVAASGTNLASIGYHFGSMEALLNAAMLASIEDWGQELEHKLAADIDPAATQLERFEAIWARVIASFSTHRHMWIATFEALAQAERSPQIRAFLGDAVQQGREGLVVLFQNVDEAAGQKLAKTVGSFYQALLTGVWVQWLIDPERAPSSRDMAQALQLILSSIQAANDTRD